MDDPKSGRSVLQRSFATPKQDACAAKITEIRLELQQALAIKQAGLDVDGKQHSKIQELEKLLKVKESELKVLKQNAERQKKKREMSKERMSKIFAENPELKKQLKARDKSKRPRLEEDQPELLKVIVDLVEFGAGAEDRRRSEDLRSVRTLDDLHEELKLRGLQISRSATYLRLLPRNRNTAEGKKHVSTVPVRLARPQADLHKAHVDQDFARASIRDIEVLLSILGPDQCICISQDDKARVALGVTAANKQSPVLMGVQYRVSL